MTVQVDIVAEGRTHLGTHRLRRGRFALGALPRFLHCEIALVEGDLSAMADRSEDLATFRSEEHTSEIQSLMRISYAVFFLIKQQELSDTIPPALSHHINHIQ